MPTFRHGKLTAVAFEDSNLTAFLNEISAALEVETGDTTTFAKTARTYVIGNQNGTFSLSGLWSGDTGGVDEVLDGQISVEDGAAVFFQQSNDTSDTSGVRCHFGLGELTSYERSSPVGDVVAVSAEVQSDGGIYPGVILHDPSGTSEETAGYDEVAAGSTTDVDSVNNGGSSSDGYIAQLHVVSNTLDAGLTVTIEESTDDSSWSTLQAFTTVTAGNTTVEQINGAGTVEQYVRINIDASGAASGTALIAVGFHRN